MFSKWLKWNWSPGPFSNSVFKTSTVRWFLAVFCFLSPLWQITANMVALTQIYSLTFPDIRSHTQVSWGWNQSTRRTEFLLEVLGANPFPWLLPICIPWLVVPAPIFELSKSWSSLLRMASDLLICLLLPLLKILWLHWAYLDDPGQSAHFKIYAYNHTFKGLCAMPGNILTYSMVPETTVECRHLLLPTVVFLLRCVFNFCYIMNCRTSESPIVARTHRAPYVAFL